MIEGLRRTAQDEEPYSSQESAFLHLPSGDLTYLSAMLPVLRKRFLRGRAYKSAYRSAGAGLNEVSA